jgi:ATP-dependent DNA helicase RecQ
MASPQLLGLLKQYFGFASFRPLQEEIIREALKGNDVFALLPTGGGKSLCFQLPAMAKPGLTVVVSPLIALMKDQVDALQASGVPATFLNSSLSPGESRARLRGLHEGTYCLLYVAPERLMLSGFLADLQQWNVSRLAIDEAHCISEWGHDFRPEYRQLAELRALFPAVPLMALTATATGRVRQDIIKQLKLRTPNCFVASFNRPNLLYRVVAKNKAYHQVLDLLRARSNESGIVYCQSRKTTENVAERLTEDGILSKPYHAGLTPAQRSAHQDLFLRDEVRVMCATIAFGMGINKSNVRFVVHYDLPKNIEGYYQETGRAGRDGLPSECILLFTAGDVVKQTNFIEEKTDPRERQLAHTQLQQMVHYAESSGCRRKELLSYFDEAFADENCGGCDNCLSPRETYDGTVSAQKFLSCIYRLRQQSGLDFGLNQIAEVLTGAETENVRKWHHDKVSTYGIGREHTRPEWKAIGRELVRLGFVSQLPEKFNVLILNPEGMALLKERKPVMLTKPVSAPQPQKHLAGEISCDEVLFERLRGLRKRFADELSLPAYIVFSDAALRQMARVYPATDQEFLRISGVGDKKLREFGAPFLREIANYLQTNPRQIFADDSFRTPPPVSSRASLGDTARQSVRRFQNGESVEQIARTRLLTVGTIFGHLAEAIEAGENVDLDRFLTSEERNQIREAFQKTGFTSLAPVFERLGGRYDYGRLKIMRSALNRERAVHGPGSAGISAGA